MRNKAPDRRRASETDTTPAGGAIIHEMRTGRDHLNALEIRTNGKHLGEGRETSHEPPETGLKVALLEQAS